MEEVQKDVPEPRGKSVTITTLVNASHALDNITRRLYIGYVIFLEGTQFYFISIKGQRLSQVQFQVNL